MKKILLLSGLIAGLFTTNASAALINITNSGGSLVNDVVKAGANNPATHLDWLNTGGSFTPGQIAGYNTITGSSLLQAIGPGTDVSASKSTSISLTGYSYITVHYGGGAGGGGWVAYYVNNEASVTLPQTGLGTYGDGGISSVYLFGPTPPNNNIPGTPDGGTTAALLGLALAGLAVARRFGLKS